MDKVVGGEKSFEKRGFPRCCNRLEGFSVSLYVRDCIQQRQHKIKLLIGQRLTKNSFKVFCRDNCQGKQ